MIRANRFARIALRIGRATKLRTETQSARFSSTRLRTSPKLAIFGQMLSGPNRAMQPRCVLQFDSHSPKSIAMRKSFFFRLALNQKSQENARNTPAKILRCWPAVRNTGVHFNIERREKPAIRTLAAVWPAMVRLRDAKSRSLKNYQHSTEGQKFNENLAPVLVIISGNSLVFSRKIITSAGFYRHCAPDASAPVVVINESPKIANDMGLSDASQSPNVSSNW